MRYPKSPESSAERRIYEITLTVLVASRSPEQDAGGQASNWAVSGDLHEIHQTQKWHIFKPHGHFLLASPNLERISRPTPKDLPQFLLCDFCHRFGQGPEVRINKLSLELVGMIEEEFLLPQREVSYSEWDNAAKCWEGRCTRADHVRSLGPKTYGPFMTDWSYRFRLDHDLLLDHEQSCKSWMERFTKSPPVKSTDNQLTLAEYDKVWDAIKPAIAKRWQTLKSDFGLETVIFHHNVNSEIGKLLGYSDWQMIFPKTTLSYLVLPSRLHNIRLR